MGRPNWAECDKDLENFLSGVNGFLNQAEADMRNHGV
jgi:hypothetical protein